TSMFDPDKPSWLSTTALKRDLPRNLYIDLFVDSKDTPLKSDTDSTKSVDLTPATACSRSAATLDYCNLDCSAGEEDYGLLQERRRCLTTEFGRFFNRMKVGPNGSYNSMKF
ncbi:hypothetical protein FOZ63_024133, partial [Perkinsus olseni]